MNESRAKFRLDWTKIKRSKLSTRSAFRILVSGFILSTLLAVMTIFMVWASYQNATLEWRERISGLAGMIGAHAKQAVTSSDNVLLALVSRINSLNLSNADELRHELTRQEFHDELAARIQVAPHVEVLAVIDAHGFVISNSLKYVPPYKFSQWEVLKDKILDDSVDRVLSNVFQTTLSLPDQPVIGIGRKIFNKSGKFLGIVGVAIRSRHFSDFYSSLPINDNYNVSLVNQNGVHLSGYPANGALGQKTPVRAFNGKLNEISHSVIVTIEPSLSPMGMESERLSAVRHIPEISMVATVSIGSDVYLSQWRANAVYFAVGGGFVTLLAFFLTFAARRVFDEMETARASAVSHAGAKTRFLSAMSHEIRTPLNAISGCAEVMLSHKLPAEMEKFASTIQNSSKHLLFLVNDVLDFARLEAGKRQFNATPFELAPVLDMTMKVAESLPGADKLTIRLKISDSTPTSLEGDCRVLTQVLLGLVSNAIKFTEEGSVELVAAFDQESSRLLLEVSDTGCGIAPDYQEIIFQPFERGGAEFSNVEGAGLGLAIVKKLVDGVGGTIRLRSAEHIGSTFIVELPMSAASICPVWTSDEAFPGGAHRSAPLRILVAEDVGTNRLVIDALLRQEGHFVHLTTNGKEALEAIRNWQFDVILMDLQMPEMNGIEATQAIREMATPAGNIPIIGLTAFSEGDQHRQMVAAGMSLYLTKPLDTRQLRAALIEVSQRCLLKDQRVDESKLVLTIDHELHNLFLADLRSARSELASCLDDEPESLRIIHKLHGLLATFDQPIIAQVAQNAEVSKQRSDALRLLDAVDRLLQSP